MGIPEMESDVEIKFLYVKKFDNPDPLERELLAGHPHQGCIYRDVYNKHTNHHRLLLPNGVPLAVDTLTSEYFDFVEITIENILDYNINEKDLNIFLTDNSDLFIQPIIHNAMSTMDREEEHFSERASQAVLSLFVTNPMKANILVDVADLLSELDLDAYSDPANYLRYHPTNGKGLNVAEALRALDRYTNDNPKVGDDISDLFVALEAIVTEIERVYTNK